MTRIKKTQSKLQQGDETIVDDVNYYEVSGSELNKLVQDVASGGDEEKLREDLIKTSKW